MLEREINLSRSSQNLQKRAKTTTIIIVPATLTLTIVLITI